MDPARLRRLLETVGALLHGAVRDATPLLTEADKEVLRTFQNRATSSAEMSRLERDRLIIEGFIHVFVRRLDNKTVARLFSRHLPEVRRAFMVAPSAKAFEKGALYVLPLVDAAIAGNADEAARGVADYWHKGLLTVVDEFEALERKN